MKNSALYPYPRLSQRSVRWSKWELQLNGTPITSEELPDVWDANSELQAFLTVQVDAHAMKALSAEQSLLYVSAACAETSEFYRSTAGFLDEGQVFTASALLELSGRNLSSSVKLLGQIFCAVEEETLMDFPWLSKRILAEATPLSVPLISDMAAFPISAFSFKEAQKFPAPWEVTVSATDPSDTFSTSVRLFLNTDLPRVVELIEGRARPYVASSLESSIARVILLALLSMSSDLPAGKSLHSLAMEFPESIAAAGQRIAQQFFVKNIDAVVRMYRNNPTLAETRLLSSTQFLQES